MGKKQLTVADALKFARHDFLNELQLVLMHIDFGDSLKARQAIMNTTDKMKQASLLAKLGLPQVEEWLMTFEWRYTTFQKTLHCVVEHGERKVNDAEIVAYLTRVFDNIVEVLNPIVEYEVQIEVEASPLNWSIRMMVNDALHGKKPLEATAIKDFLVEEKFEDNLWMLTMSGQ